MITVLFGRSVPANHLPTNSVTCVAELPTPRLPRATAVPLPPVQVALAALPFTSALAM